jgi:hypothetical protein
MSKRDLRLYLKDIGELEDFIRRGKDEAFPNQNIIGYKNRRIVGEDSGADKSLSQSSSSNSLWPKYYKIKQEELKEMVKLLGFCSKS